MRKLVLSAAAAMLAATPALAADLTVSDAWFRALPAKLPAGGYFKLHNGGTKMLALLGASSPACGMLMLHLSADDSDVQSMTAIDRLFVPAGATVEFKPGSYHLMCENPTPAMKPGAKLPVTLVFADGTKLNADFAVKNAKGQ